MNWPLLKYRLSIGGVPWAARTAAGLVAATLVAERRNKGSYCLGPDEPGLPRVLYVHSGWAIENVGLLWFGNVSRAKVTFIAAADPGLTADLAAWSAPRKLSHEL